MVNATMGQARCTIPSLYPEDAYVQSGNSIQCAASLLLHRRSTVVADRACNSPPDEAEGEALRDIRRVIERELKQRV